MANKIIEALDVPWVVLLSMDSFYKVRKKIIWVVNEQCPGQPPSGSDRDDLNFIRKKNNFHLLIKEYKFKCCSRGLQVLSPEEQTLAASNDYDFDHPGAFDFELLVATLRKLKQGKSVKIPVYNFTTHNRQKDWVSAHCLGVSLFYPVMKKPRCKHRSKKIL